jgi:uncharacterized membrane protein
MSHLAPLTDDQADNRIETYLDRLDAALASVAPQEKQDIVREIRVHILDSIAHATDRDGAIERVLRLLGTPAELAERYSTECLLTRAGRSASPWLLLRTTWQWAKLGIRGVAAFLLAIVGYSAALGLTVALLLKPFMPHRVGMWVGPRGLIIGVPLHRAGMHEVLGQWFIPVSAVFAFVFAAGTTRALHWLIRRRSPKPVVES